MGSVTVDPFISLEKKFDMPRRMRRNRRSAAIRKLVSETHLLPSDFVAPLFLTEASEGVEVISSMPGVYRLSETEALKQVELLLKSGIQSVDLFAAISAEKKDPHGSYAWNPENGLVTTLQAIKREFPELWVMVDIALDPFTDHGHDGILNESGYVENDATLDALARMTLVMAEAGADMVAPSDMMDGRIGYLRNRLDESGFDHVGILSYAAKYASGFYGPFRDALQSAPKFGDKASYQMNPANSREALLEAELDIEEGADLLLVKPALPYLDVLAKMAETSPVPVGGYHVSGEYAMIKAAGEKGWLDPERTMYESVLSIKRAGADFILSYAALEVLEYQKRLNG